jgi:hypothetical protein
LNQRTNHRNLQGLILRIQRSPKIVDITEFVFACFLDRVFETHISHIDLFARLLARGIDRGVCGKLSGHSDVDPLSILALPAEIESRDTCKVDGGHVQQGFLREEVVWNLACVCVRRKVVKHIGSFTQCQIEYRKFLEERFSLCTKLPRGQCDRWLAVLFGDGVEALDVVRIDHVPHLGSQFHEPWESSRAICLLEYASET